MCSVRNVSGQPITFQKPEHRWPHICPEAVAGHASSHEQHAGGCALPACCAAASFLATSNASRWLHSNLRGSQYHVKISASTNKKNPSFGVMVPYFEWRRSSWSSKAEWPSMNAVTMHVNAMHCAVA